MTTLVIPCRAQNPDTCKYHGAQRRAEAALTAGDQEAYLVAQIDLAAAIKSTPEVNDFFTNVSTATQPIETYTRLRRSPNVMNDAVAGFLAEGWANHQQVSQEGWRVEQDNPATHGTGKLSDRELIVSQGNDVDGKTYYRFAYNRQRDTGRIIIVPNTLTEVHQVTEQTDQIQGYANDDKTVPDSVRNPAFLAEITDHLGQVPTSQLRDITGLISYGDSPYYYSVNRISRWGDDEKPDDFPADTDIYTIYFEDLTAYRTYATEVTRHGQQSYTELFVDDEVRSVAPTYHNRVSYV